MSRAVLAALVAVTLAVSLAAGPGLAGADGRTLQTPDGFDSTTFRVTVYGNGSATWTIEHRQPLSTEGEVDEFEAYAAEFEANETELYRDFVEDAAALTEFGSRETGREMTAESFGRSAAVDPAQSQGTVRMSFRWENFASVTGDRVTVSDVFAGGFYIGTEQRMVFERGPGLAFASARPTPDTRSQPDSLAGSESVSWVGERSFNDSRPYVELGPRGAVQDGGETPGSAGGDGPGMLPFLALAVIVLGVIGAVAWRSGAVAAVVGSTGDDGGSAGASATDSAESNPESGPQPTPDPVNEADLLSDDDRVLKLLEANGGRMKQVDIVETTDWSKSKVSMLLSEMEDEGEISKLRVGRENIISLAGEEPDAAGSPFDDE